jgi:hypothetical protein
LEHEKRSLSRFSKNKNDQVVEIWRAAGFKSIELHSGSGISQEYPCHWHDDVNGAEQAALVVNDPKLRERHGKIALWVGTDTEGYFSDLIVEPER